MPRQVLYLVDKQVSHLFQLLARIGQSIRDEVDEEFDPVRVVYACEKLGFAVVRQKGSHRFLRQPDGRVCSFAFHDKVTIGRAMPAKLVNQAGVAPEDLNRFL